MKKIIGFVFEKFMAASLTLVFFYGLYHINPLRPADNPVVTQAAGNYSQVSLLPERIRENFSPSEEFKRNSTILDSGSRTDRHANPTAMIWTPEVENFFLSRGYDVKRGDAFPDKSRYFTLDMTKVPDPVQATIDYIDEYTFYTPYGQQRWDHTALPDKAWQKLTNEEKKNVINVIYNRESGTAGLLFSKKPTLKEYLFKNDQTKENQIVKNQEQSRVSSNQGRAIYITIDVSRTCDKPIEESPNIINQYGEYADHETPSSLKSYSERWGSPILIELDDDNWHLVLSNPRAGQRVLYISIKPFKVADDGAETIWQAAPETHQGWRFMNGDADGALRFKKDQEDTRVYVWIKT